MTEFTFMARRQTGFTLIELMIVVVIIGILAKVAMPNYSQYVVRSSRSAAQGELLALASVQEKIFLNSNNYAFSVTGAYNGTSAGGLGLTSGKTQDGKYTITLDITAASQTYTLTATPVSGSSQASDGNLSINQSGQKLWGSASW
jgi:type IV pilus assembly protein PilE